MAEELVTVDRFNREIDRLDEGLDKLDRKIEVIDQGGTRGLGVLAVQMTELAKDVTRIETAVTGIAEEQKRVRGGGWKNFVLYALAMIPVYSFVVAWFINK